MKPAVHGTFPYAQARMQARIGRRGEAGDLQRAHAARDLPGFLQQVRSSPWGHHVARLAPGMNVHELERRLREEWCATVDEVARWLPAEWQPTVQWLRWLPWLPALQKLARGGRAPAWMREDPVLARIVAADRAERARKLAETALQPLERAVASHGDVTAAWLARWRQLWPADARARAALGAIVRDVGRAVDVLAVSASTNATADASATLRRALLRAFRRRPLAPDAAIAWLGLEALDLLELRGGVAMRATLVPEAA